MFLLSGGALVIGLVIVGALQLLPRQGGGSTSTAELTIPAKLPPAELADGRALGSADAPVNLTIWSDFQCPACRSLALDVEPRLVTDYVATGKLRIEYRDLIVVGPESLAAAGASRCAEEQGRFWDYHAVLFANQLPENSGRLDRARLAAMADKLGLDRQAFDACVDSGHVQTHVETESASGRTRFQSTPTLDFGLLAIPGVPAWENLSRQVDELVTAAEAA